MAEQQRHRGTVIWFNVKYGYGYIKPDDPKVNDGKDLFVHFHYIIQRGFKQFNKGDVVEFAIGENHRGACAADVKLVQSAQEESDAVGV